MIRRPPRSTLFPTRRSSDLVPHRARRTRPQASVVRAQRAAPAHASNANSAASHGHGVLRSEEHTSELQSHVNLVCRLLLEKKKNQHNHYLTCTHTHLHTVST